MKSGSRLFYTCSNRTPYLNQTWATESHFDFFSFALNRKVYVSRRAKILIFFSSFLLNHTCPNLALLWRSNHATQTSFVISSLAALKLIRSSYTRKLTEFSNDLSLFLCINSDENSFLVMRYIWTNTLCHLLLNSGDYGLSLFQWKWYRSVQTEHSKLFLQIQLGINSTLRNPFQDSNLLLQGRLSSNYMWIDWVSVLL